MWHVWRNRSENKVTSAYVGMNVIRFATLILIGFQERKKQLHCHSWWEFDRCLFLKLRHWRTRSTFSTWCRNVNAKTRQSIGKFELWPETWQCVNTFAASTRLLCSTNFVCSCCCNLYGREGWMLAGKEAIGEGNGTLYTQDGTSFDSTRHRHVSWHWSWCCKEDTLATRDLVSVVKSGWCLPSAKCTSSGLVSKMSSYSFSVNYTAPNCNPGICNTVSLCVTSFALTRPASRDRGGDDPIRFGYSCYCRSYCVLFVDSTPGKQSSSCEQSAGRQNVGCIVCFTIVSWSPLFLMLFQGLLDGTQKHGFSWTCCGFDRFEYMCCFTGTWFWDTDACGASWRWRAIDAIYLLFPDPMLWTCLLSNLRNCSFRSGAQKCFGWGWSPCADLVFSTHSSFRFTMNVGKTFEIVLASKLSWQAQDFRRIGCQLEIRNPTQPSRALCCCV